MIDTSTGVQIDSVYLQNYFESLVNKFFKILPMREENEKSLNEYLKSFQRELIGCGEFITAVKDDGILAGRSPKGGCAEGLSVPPLRRAP